MEEKTEAEEEKAEDYIVKELEALRTIHNLVRTSLTRALKACWGEVKELRK